MKCQRVILRILSTGHPKATPSSVPLHTIGLPRVKPRFVVMCPVVQPIEFLPRLLKNQINKVQLNRHFLWRFLFLLNHSQYPHNVSGDFSNTNAMMNLCIAIPMATPRRKVVATISKSILFISSYVNQYSFTRYPPE